MMNIKKQKGRKIADKRLLSGPDILESSSYPRELDKTT